jgi:glyoxylase-like metal-dependent hydrolase (beta-lactamase superfamily II)
MAVNIPALPAVEQVSTSIWRVLGGNPSKFTLQGTNTYLLGRGKERILIDTAQGFDAWRSSLYEVLQKDGADVKIKTCILTHWHHDHVMGIPDVKKHNPDVKVYKHLGNSYDPDQTLTNEEIIDFADGAKFSVGSEMDGDLFEVEALYTPGHAKDHMCLLISKSPDPEEVGCIFTADNVLGHGTSVFEDLAQYVASLERMKKRVGEGRRAFPGHGSVINDANQKLEEYITHRQMREDEAMNVLCYGTTTAPGKAPLKTAEGFPQSVPPLTEQADEEVKFGKEWESIEMVKIIYRLYPENLWGPAEGGLLQVLDKLEGNGKVVKTAEGKWKVSDLVMESVRAEAASFRSRSPSKL